MSVHQGKRSTMKNSTLFHYVMLVTLLFCQHLSFAQPDLSLQNPLPAGIKLNSSSSTDTGTGIASGQAGTTLYTVDGGSDCGCKTIGPFVNPNKGFPPTVKPDFTSPKGKYKLTVTGAGPYNLTVKLASNSSTVYQTSVPEGGWGFSPDDDRFVTTYSNSGIENTRMVDLTVSPARQVWSSAVLTGTSRLQFSPYGDYLMYNAITAAFHNNMSIIDTRSGRTVYQTEFTFQSVPGDPGEKFGMVTWGFSPDTSSRTFVYAWVSGQNSVEFSMVNLETRLVVRNTTILTISAYWQFSPCGDVLGLVKETSPIQIMVQLYKTASLEAALAEQTHTFLDPILLSTNNSSHIISVGGTPYTLSSNTADSPCSNEFVGVSVPDTLTGGLTGTGTVRLNIPAFGTAVTVTLSSSSPSLVTVPSNVTIPVGVKTKTFTIQSSVVQANTPVVINATAIAVTNKDTMILRALKIQSLQLPDAVIGGTTVQGTVMLNDFAPAAGIPVTLESDTPSVAPVPEQLTILSGTKSRNFSFRTTAVADPVKATITAKSSNSQKSTTLTILPANLDSIKLTPSSVKGGNPASLKIYLDGVAPPDGALILLSSSNPGIAFLPETTIISAPEKSMTVPVTTIGVASEESVIFTASYREASVTGSLSIQPADLYSVVRNACAVCGTKGGEPTDITLYLDGQAPPGGAVISLSSNDPSHISAPATVTIPEGLSSIAAPLTTSAVLTGTTVRITAQYGSTQMDIDIVLGTAGKYSVTDLGIPTGFLYTNGIAINDSNAVLVQAYGGTSPQKTSFLWRNGQRTYFPPPPNYGSSFYVIGSDVNNKGNVTGAFGTAVDNEQAFLWIDGLTSLLPFTAYTSGGFGINDSGWIIGFRDEGSGGQDFIYRDGNVSSLESLPGATSKTLRDVNNKGQVVGYSDAGAFFWEGGEVTEIKPVEGFNISQVNAVNDSGYVVGYLHETSSGAWRAFVWRDSIMDLLSLPPGVLNIFASGINNNGEIVGDFFKNDGSYIHYGMVYRNGVASDLNELIPDASRCMVNYANKINNSGSIVATGIINGETHAMLLTPPGIINTGIGPEEMQSTGYRLGQNFPNPFNTGTTIPYHLPEAAYVRLTIMDMLGREVAILVDEMQPAGEKSVEFQARDFPAGIYFYRLQAGTHNEIKKLLLLR
jgi:hypothetical protein